jgi:glycosyltransferase involved in cell wall biosynthesis
MILKNNLEIILLTYNRKEKLSQTLLQIFADNSPIKNLNITILNNKSTDGSTDLIEEYAKKFPNIKHIIHNRNIGGNANISRAFEIATEKYVWVLCDDDEYDWDNWGEVEKAIKENYDLIVVANYLEPRKNIYQLIKQLTFVPAGIYKTEHITDTTVINANFNVANMFPQMAIFGKFINDNRKIYVCNKSVVNMCDAVEQNSYTRGLDEDKHPYMAKMYWPFGFVNSIQVFKNKKLRAGLIDNIDLENRKGFSAYIKVIDTNKHFCDSFCKNLYDFFVALNFRQKTVFLLAYLSYITWMKLLNVNYQKDFIHFTILGIIKTRIKLKNE